MSLKAPHLHHPLVPVAINVHFPLLAPPPLLLSLLALRLLDFMAPAPDPSPLPPPGRPRPAPTPARRQRRRRPPALRSRSGGAAAGL